MRIIARALSAGIVTGMVLNHLWGDALRDAAHWGWWIGLGAVGLAVAVSPWLWPRRSPTVTPTTFTTEVSRGE